MKRSADSQETLSSHSKRRWKAILYAAISSAGAKAIAMACSLVQVPIALHFLGQEAFGLWMTLSSAVALMSFADLGIGVGVQNSVAEAYADSDLTRITRIFTTGFLLMAAIGAGVFAVGALVCYGVNWTSLFRVKDSALAELVRPALFLVLGLFTAGLPLNAFPRVATGLQLGWINGIAIALGSVLALCLVIVASILKVPFLVFLAMALLPPILVNLITGGILFAHLKWRFTQRWSPDFSLTRPLMRQGIVFLIPQINTMILLTAPQLIISATLGVSAVTPYNLCQRLLNIVTQLTQMAIGPLWPAYTEARARGDWTWIATAYRRSLFVSMACAFPLCLAFALRGREIILLWSRNAQGLPETQLVILMSLFTFVLAMGQPGFYLLGGCKQLDGISWYATLTSAAFLLSVYPLAAARGVVGVALSLLASYTVFTFICSLVEVTGLLRRNTNIPAHA